MSATSRARQEAASALDLIYETADGYMTVAALTDRQWAGLARAVERPEWLDDERFKTPALRQQNIEARLELTQQALMTRPAAEWLERLTAAQVPCGPVLTRNQVIRHPQVEALGLVVETEHEKAGRSAPGAGGGAVFRDRRPKSAAAPRRSASTRRRSLREARLFGRRDRSAASRRCAEFH